MMDSLINLLKTPKTQIGFFLTLIFIAAFINNPSQKAPLVFVLSLISSACADLLFLKLRNIKPFSPSAALVTGSIIGLLTAPHLSWYVPVVIGIAAMFSKNFLRISNHHIFNPAAFGLFFASLIFGHNVSWWGVSFQQFSIFNFQLSIPFIILLSPALVSMLRMRRYRITLSFLTTYILLNQLLNPPAGEAGLKSSILNLITDPTVLFFSIVMLPEPMTTPNRHFRQVLFGIFVCIISILTSLSIFHLPSSIFRSYDPLIFSLLLGNLLFAKFK